MTLTYYTDGACWPNPGPGAWGYICLQPYIEQAGFDFKTTSNRMELTAILMALNHARSLKADKIQIFSDSQYSVRGFTSWIEGWHRNDWKRQDGEILVPVKNDDLWRQLWTHRRQKGVILTWIKGHNGNEYNEAVDNLVEVKLAEIQ